MNNVEFRSLQDVKLRIDKNYECIKELEKYISIQDTEEGQLEVLSLIGKMYAGFVTGIYSSNILEQQIVDVGNKINYVPSNKSNDAQILIVMSACAAIGGHTIIVHNWISWDDESMYSIVFTDMKEQRAPDFIENAVQKSGGNLMYLSGSYTEKAVRLMEISEGFERILLFTHMEDIIPLLAYGNRHWQIPVYFYNHADFRFSYGFSVSDMVLNLNEFDVDKTSRYRGIDKNRNECIQFPGQGKLNVWKDERKAGNVQNDIKQKYGIAEDEKLIVSMGSDFKYESIIGYEFDVYADSVIREYEGLCSFLIIGADIKKEKWIALKERTGGKARALGILPREEAEQIIAVSDVYIISFPMAAYGGSAAEQAKVPWLWLNIYGRGVKTGDIRYAGSVEELTEKTLDILNGNGQKYLNVQNFGVWTRQEWKEKWHRICRRVTCHKLHTFYPQRHLEKQEYVNCQLMQEQAAESVCNYICEYSLGEPLIEELFRLDRKYDMGIIYKYALYQKRRCKDWERLCDNLTGLCDRRLQLSDKHLELYLTAMKWLETKRKEKQIDSYLYYQGYRTAAIYGMSYMGRCLVSELSGSSIKVLYGIDRNAENLSSEIPIFKPEDIPGDVDVILNTTIMENTVILAGLGVHHIPMIQMSKLLNMI